MMPTSAPTTHADRSCETHGRASPSADSLQAAARRAAKAVRLWSLPRSRTFWLSLPFLLAIRTYQIILGPVMGGHCRFYPTCSHYALDAYRLHGPIRGTWLTAWRILRCQPFCKGGIDLVPKS